MLHDQNVHKTDDAGANKSNTAMQSLYARTGQQNGGGERHGQVGLQKRKSDGKKKKNRCSDSTYGGRPPRTKVAAVW